MSQLSVNTCKKLLAHLKDKNTIVVSSELLSELNITVDDIECAFYVSVHEIKKDDKYTGKYILIPAQILFNARNIYYPLTLAADILYEHIRVINEQEYSKIIARLIIRYLQEICFTPKNELNKELIEYYKQLALS